MEKKLKIAIIGYGYVGQAVVNLFKDHYEVLIYDPMYKPVSMAKQREKTGIDNIEFVGSTDKLNQCALAVICVPTLMKNEDTEFKACDTGIVEETVKKLETPLILIKSTIEPGTIDRLKRETGKRLVFSPEYAGEGKYWSPYKFAKDMKECPFVILGGDSQDTKEVLDFLVPILGPKKFYYQVTAKEAELIKYMENTYFGVKVTFANEMKKICEALGVDYYKVRTGWALDPRVDQMHTLVFPNEPGFGGKCLPKDINGIIRASQKAGYEPEFIKEVIRSNDRFRKDLNSDNKNT